MKKRLLAVMILTAAIGTAGCGNSKQETSAPEISTEETKQESAATKEIKIDTETTSKETTEEETTQTETEETTEESKKEGKKGNGELPAAYEEILEKYRKMIQEDWDLDQAYQENLSGIVVDLGDMGDASKETGYFLDDLDQDGNPELLIGEMDNDMPENRIIFDAYTLVNGKAQQIFSSESRNRYYLVKDDSGAILIANEASNSAANSGWLYYTLNGADLKIVQAVMCDAEADEQNPWFLSTDDDWDVSNDEPIDEDKAMSIIDTYTKNYIQLDFMPVVE